MRSTTDAWVYHEKQESALCGQHCLNNLLQTAYFSAPDLSDIALELDASERSLNNSSNIVSGNVDVSGNFSIQVLRTALHRSNSLDLVSWTSEVGRDTKDPTEEMGFIVNANDHWFTIRRIGSKWWNLNSTLDKPAYISNFYLSAMLSQYREEGFAVFLVVGHLPDFGTKNDFIGAVGPACWYNENELLPMAQRNISSSSALTVSAPFSGTAHRLGSSAESGPTVLSDKEVIEMLDSDGVYEEDEDLRRAILLSMTEHSSAVPQKTQNEIMREKRLQMLEKGGSTA